MHLWDRMEESIIKQATTDKLEQMHVICSDIGAGGSWERCVAQGAPHVGG